MNTSPNKIHNFPSEYDIKKHVEHTVVYNIVQYTIFEVVGKVKKGITQTQRHLIILCFLFGYTDSLEISEGLSVPTHY